MGTLNYKHLHYFWAVAKAGSVTRASELLHLTPQTISDHPLCLGSGSEAYYAGEDR